MVISLRWLAFPVLLACCGCQSKPALDFGAGLDVPYVQTSPGVVHQMLELAHVRPGETVIDLGCGDGRIVIAAAKDFHARGIGYDIDPQRIAEARAAASAAGVSSQTEFIQQDLFQAPIWNADVVTVFLLPPVMDRLLPRLKSELSPGARIVSHSFLFHAWSPEKTIHPEGRTLHLWTMPPRAK